MVYTQYYPSDNNAHSGYYDDLLGREFLKTVFRVLWIS
jgi:hypothetical protein